MSQSWKSRASIGVSIPGPLCEAFEAALAREGQSMAKAVGQFLGNYVEHLDRSFVAERGLRTQARRSTNRSLLLPEEIVGRAREKASREGVSLSRLVEQFIRNYLDFMNEEGGEASGAE